jgi:hypothetical protein
MRAISTLIILATVTLATLNACGGDDDPGGGPAVEDTAVISGETDTVSQPTVVPTTDSVVTTTTMDSVDEPVSDKLPVRPPRP